MQADTWTPGYIPELVKVGQILLGLSMGLLLGRLNERGGYLLPVLGFSGFLAGLIGAYFVPVISALNYFTPAIFLLLLVCSIAIAANLGNKLVISGISWPILVIMGASSLPSQAWFPDALLVVTVNAIGIALLTTGAAALSHWITYIHHRQWLTICVRVLGAWLVAIAILMLSFYVSAS